ncbi:AraC family transcriptional regulator ligand-binding domain-containing protein [Hoeflea sp.]|uniref:helix-turn-helix transcriptional regulator n=1 Tax=Hoeflea sp. TaxID=1940281 RepID=UPI003B01FA78
MSKHRYRIGRQIKAASAFIGVQPAAVLRRAGLSVHIFDDADAEFDPAQYFAIWAAAEGLSSDPGLGVTLGRKMPHLPFGSALVAFSCADTIRTGLDRLSLFKPLIAPIRIDHRETGEGYLVRFLPLGDGLHFSALLANFEGSYFVELCRLLTGHEIAPLKVGTIAPAPALREFLGIAPHTSDAPEILFRHADIDLPLISENADIWQGLEPILSKKMLEFDRNTCAADRVRAELIELLPSGRSSIDDVCGRLGVGRRNLQLRLAQDGTSFRSVLEDLRRDLAVAYLRDDTMRVEEVSYLLGFADPNSFYRAFRDWTGMTPAEARNLH